MKMAGKALQPKMIPITPSRVKCTELAPSGMRTNEARKKVLLRTAMRGSCCAVVRRSVSVASRALPPSR